MIIIFDLDYTLLDSKKFKADLAQVFNLSKNSFAHNYKKNFRDRKINFNPDLYLEILIKEKKINLLGKQKIKRRLKYFLSKINKYLFKEAGHILKKLSAKNNKLILLTYGDIAWQKEKIKSLKIKKYFSKIIITSENKANFLGFVRKTKESIIIINDNARESFRIRKTLGRGEIFLIKGPYSKNIKHKFKIYNLKEFQSVVEPLIGI